MFEEDRSFVGPFPSRSCTCNSDMLLVTIRLLIQATSSFPSPLIEGKRRGFRKEGSVTHSVVSAVLVAATRSPFADEDSVNCRNEVELEVSGRCEPVRASNAQICMTRLSLRSAGAKMVEPSGLHAGWPTAAQPLTLKSRMVPEGNSMLISPISSSPPATAARAFGEGDHSRNQNARSRGRLSST